MNIRNIFLGLLVASLISSCGITNNFSEFQTPAPAQRDVILIKDTGDLTNLTFNFGGGFLTLMGGATDLVNGQTMYNFPELKPTIEVKDGKVIMGQGNISFKNLPQNNGLVNQWDLQIGSTPLALNINAGAYKGNFDLGGLNLTDLAIADGACEVTLDFSSPNPEVLRTFTYKTGASNITLLRLANANLANFIFDSGAGNYRLDFSGDFIRDANVTIRSGLSNFTLTIPKNLDVAIQVNSGLTNIQVPSLWVQNGDTYSQPNQGPRLNILVEMGAGNLQIIQ